jgi:hypothetical protein
MIICIHRQRQEFIVLNNAQQCYMSRSIRPFSGMNVHDLRKKEDGRIDRKM